MDKQLKQENNIFIFDEIQRFYGKYATVKYCDKWGVIDNKGEWVIKPCYPFLHFYTTELFIAKDNELYGIIDVNKNVVLPFKYKSLSCIDSETLLIAQSEEKFGVINGQGDIIVPIEYDEISEESNDKLFIIKKSDKWGVINSNNKVLVPFEYDEVELGKDFLIGEKDGLYGLVDYSNNVIIPFVYKELSPFAQGTCTSCLSIKENLTFAAKKQDDKFIIIDSENKMVSEQEFENIFSIGTELYSACINNKACAIDRFGNIKIPLGKFNTTYCFHELSNGELVSLIENDKHEEALINRDGEIIVPFEAGYHTDGYMYTKGDCILMRKEDKFGVIDQDNNIIIPFKYDWIFYENETYSGANIGGRWGYIDQNGQSLSIKKY